MDERPSTEGARKTYRFVVADVFTDVALAGNQLAVFTDARGIPEQLLQPLALEIGFSETAFVYPPAGAGHVALRIFTPTAEVRFAGHPVLGTAFVLAAPMQLQTIVLETAAGLVPVALEREGSRIAFGRMQQPLPTWKAYERADELVGDLGVASSGLPVEVYDNGLRHAYVALGSRDEVRRLAPTSQALARYDDVDGVNCFAGAGGEWKTRMFAPGVGVPEDAATGSAAGPLAVHLARHGRIAWGDEIRIEQGAELGRPSTLYARAEGSEDALDRVEVGGAAVVVARGEFRL